MESQAAGIDGYVRPDTRHQIMFVDDAARLLQEHKKNIQRARRQMDRRRTLSQRPLTHPDYERAERHFIPLRQRILRNHSACPAKAPTANS
ncbi:hypothetical protein SSBR45G_52490 [Bradyrhizobium sp. SSBR45G]|nr:hypothetical protein SSBR45G_52490 [Bradyrhizobium sp. SSBR45G]GLH87834.1 hypothetical protein SSBR45R_52940 [Bradyrhizobium sp. SSBR45R]